MPFFFFFFPLPLLPGVFAVTTDAAGRKELLSTEKGAKNIRAALNGNGGSRLSSQPVLREGEHLHWGLGEPHALMLMEGEGWFSHGGITPATLLCVLPKMPLGTDVPLLGCLCAGTCRRCWGSISGFLRERQCLQDTSLGALPHLCLFSLGGGTRWTCDQGRL